VRAEDFTEVDEVQELLGRLRRAYAGKRFSDVVDDRGNQYAELVIEPPGLLGTSEQTTTGASRTSSGR
jgi:hypothetical protein